MGNRWVEHTCFASGPEFSVQLMLLRNAAIYKEKNLVRGWIGCISDAIAFP
jgi:hypothetical protein